MNTENQSQLNHESEIHHYLDKSMQNPKTEQNNIILNLVEDGSMVITYHPKTFLIDKVFLNSKKDGVDVDLCLSILQYHSLAYFMSCAFTGQILGVRKYGGQNGLECKLLYGVMYVTNEDHPNSLTYKVNLKHRPSLIKYYTSIMMGERIINHGKLNPSLIKYYKSFKNAEDIYNYPIPTPEEEDEIMKKPQQQSNNTLHTPPRPSTPTSPRSSPPTFLRSSSLPPDDGLYHDLCHQEFEYQPRQQEIYVIKSYLYPDPPTTPAEGSDQRKISPLKLEL